MKANIVKTTIKGIGLASILVILSALYLYHDRVLSFFNLSWITEKCILCNFENRHHCNRCLSSQEQCPFCDKSVQFNNN